MVRKARVRTSILPVPLQNAILKKRFFEVLQKCDSQQAKTLPTSPCRPTERDPNIRLCARKRIAPRPLKPAAELEAA